MSRTDASLRGQPQAFAAYCRNEGKVVKCEEKYLSSLCRRNVLAAVSPTAIRPAVMRDSGGSSEE